MISKKTALDIFKSAINSVTADNLFCSQIRMENNVLTVLGRMYDLTQFKNIYVIGAGKASAQMALSLENQMGAYITDGAVITKYGHSVSCNKIRIYEAGHPVPDENTLKYSAKIIAVAKKAAKDDLVICLISGGGSALLEALPESILPEHLQMLNDVLLKCGAAIDEINTVRKHISLLKGGKLAKMIHPASGFSLIISDVLNDPLESIASGPTAPDSGSFEQALQVIEKYGLSKKIAAPVINYLKEGLAAKLPGTIKPDDPVWSDFRNFILGNNLIALNTARQKAQSLGMDSKIIRCDFRGEAKEVALQIVAVMKKAVERGVKRQCLLFGGESTVTIRGNGKGGRNQELALAALIALEKFNHRYVVLSAGTDGTDGPTDAAGAIFTNETWDLLKKKKLDAKAYLKDNDSYHFFEQVDGLVKTGPTGTNVMDIVIVLLNES